MRRLRLVVLVSGRGSNMENLVRASREGRMAADVVRVLSNRPDAPALERAKALGVEALAVDSRGRSREEHEALLRPLVEEVRPDLVALAGYMRILTPAFIRAYEGRLVNVHPSLLPAFPGLDAQLQAHQAAVRIAGCTTHFVTPEVDAGPILMQAAVAIPPGASPEEVRRRILAAEHRIYPETIHLLATGRARWDAGRVAFSGARAPEGVLVSPGVAE